METILLVAAFLAFIAWRERQHAHERAALASRRGDRALISAAPSRRRKREKAKARVISAENDKAFLEAKGIVPEEEQGEQGSLEPGETEDED